MNKQLTYNAKTLLLLSGAIVLVMLIISGYVWTQIPAGEEVCIHWNSAGECDGYGGKFMGIFLLPLVGLGTAGLFAALPRLEPRAGNLAQSRKPYHMVWGGMMVFLLAIHIVIMLEVLGRATSIGTAMPIIMGILFLLLGNYMGKIRSNFFFGIRTPWTLSSDLSWDKTHRLGGKLFMLQGLLFIASAFILTAEAWTGLLLGSVLLLVVVLTAYSYAIWRQDTKMSTL